MKKIEFLLFVLALLAVLMRYNDIPGSRYLILFTGICLMSFYLITGIGITRKTFFLSAMRFHPHGMRPVFYARAFGGIAFSFCLYTFYLHEYYRPMREIAGIGAAALLTFVMFFSFAMVERRDREMNLALIVRSVIASAILIFYTLVPIRTRLSWQFDDLYYREILEYSIRNPQDEESRKEVEDYERRLEGLSPKEDQGVEETQ
jgi:hypothetical protein